MPIYLRQSTASQEVTLGPFVDSTDGNTEETGLTIANTDIKLHVAGATTLANKTSGGATHISNGIYYAVLDATDTATVGPLVIYCHPSGALATRTECVVLTANVYDSLIAGSDLLDINVSQFGGTNGTFASGRPETNTSHIAGSAVSTSSAQIGVNVVNAGGTAWASGALTSGVFAAGAITASAIAADAIGASELAADAVAEIADAVWDEATTSHTTSGTFGEQLKTDVDAILADTGTDGVVVASIATGAITAAAIAADAIGASELAADAVSEIAAAISIPSAATIADAVWDEDATAHQTQGTFGQAVGDPGADSDSIWAITNAQGATGTGLSAIPWNAAWDAEVESEVDDALGGGTGTALTGIPWNASWDAEVQSEVQDALDATLADSVPSDGTRPSIAQALYMLVQFMTERSVSGTTVTVKKADGSTSLMTFTLNDATAPTSITRAT